MRAIATAAVAALIVVPLTHPGPLLAQSLSSRPVLFADPVPGRATPGRELELGVTTLASAKRIFAVELDEPVQVRRGFGGNPETVRAGTEWTVMGHTIRPERRLDLGPDHYALYFDANQRLISVHTARLPRPVTRDEFMTRYPQARVDRRMHGGDISLDYLVVPMGACIVLTAVVRVPTARIEELGYVYTCATKP